MIEPLRAQALWTDGRDREFRIISLVQDLEGHDWVHYRNIKTEEEYSCWQESFLLRFQPKAES